MVPNIREGLNIHECDMLILNKNDYAVEVEIKISKADIKKDLQKGHGHHSKKIRRLFFAIPEKLNTEEIHKLIPERAGIFVITDPVKIYNDVLHNGKPKKVSFIIPPKCHMVRTAKINKSARQFTDYERGEMGRLGMLRYWNIRHNFSKFPIVENKGQPIFSLQDMKDIALAMIYSDNGQLKITPRQYFLKHFKIDIGE